MVPKRSKNVVVGLSAAGVAMISSGLIGFFSLDRGLVSASDAYAAEMRGATLLVDIREPYEIAQGTASHSARAIYRSDGSLDDAFVANIAAQAADKSTDIILMCRTGVRSAAARDLLAERGFSRVKSLAGGFEAWREQGLPTRREE